MDTDLKPGDRVLYRITDRKWLPGAVLRVGEKRIAVKLDDHALPRNTVPSQLRREAAL